MNKLIAKASGETVAPHELSDELRETFRQIADVLIPRYREMPPASEVGVHGNVIDHLLGLRSDLKERFLRGLAACQGADADASVRALNENDPKALAAIGLLASAAYYIDEGVRERIGYPGQSHRDFDADETPEYMVNGQLQAVIDRGPIFRPTPPVEQS